MSIETSIEAMPVVFLTKAVMEPHGEVLRPAHPITPPSQEHVQALESVFASKERESETVQTLLGMWTSVALLHDLAAETFSPAVGEFEREEAEWERNKQKR